MSKDILGTALFDYLQNPDDQVLYTHTSIAGDDEMPVGYFFRNYEEMPTIEQKALDLSKGKILDVGCGAGSHSLYLQKKGFDVTAIDISEKAIKTCKTRGLEKAICQDIFLHENEKYDTILALMNGGGFCGKLNKLADFLLKLSSLLNKGGQILVDSSDVIYMYEDENGDHWIDASVDYYGEVVFEMTFSNETSAPFHWLYVDYNTLQRCANYNGLACELVTEGEHYDYLASLTKL